MKVIVTTGPSYEPIDEVRRLTNFSTGELGVLLANTLEKTGREVFCLRGEGSTYPGVLEARHHISFTTNDHLFKQLVELSRSHEIGALFHVAALCDFKVSKVENADGTRINSPKIDSRSSGLTIHLQPAMKIIGELRALFPQATIVGWKYELAGTREQALAKAWRHVEDNRTNACVLNGRAWGEGFAFCNPPCQVQEWDSKPGLARFLASWLESR